MSGPSYDRAPLAADLRVHIDAAWGEGYAAGYLSGEEVGSVRTLLHLRAGWPDLGSVTRLVVSREYRDLLDGPGVATPCTCSCCRRAGS